MIRLLQLLFFGHFHKWEVIKVVGVYERGERPIGHMYTLQCKGCGNIKTKDAMP